MNKSCCVVIYSNDIHIVRCCCKLLPKEDVIYISPFHYNLSLGIESEFFNAYERFVSVLNPIIQEVDRLLIIIDVCEYAHDLETFYNGSPLDVSTGSQAFCSLLGMIALTYPEADWFIFNGKNPFNEFSKRIKKLYSGYTPLFDARGLRHKIKKNILEKQSEQVRYLPKRNNVVVAIDEELDYAYFISYIAYRLGYRAYPIVSWSLGEELFYCSTHNNDSSRTNCPQGCEKSFNDTWNRLLGSKKIARTFEDRFLMFPDRPSNVENFSNLFHRLTYWGGLGFVNSRVAVTVGHKHHSKESSQMQSYCTNYDIQPVYKPISGMYDFMKKAGLWDNSDDFPKHAEEFKWPPQELKESLEFPSKSHSSPGRLLAIAKNLINRSKNILDRTQNVPDAIRAAVLALEAKELLGYKTPTTSLEALSLQHQAEVTAESMFFGVESKFEVKKRFDEIEMEVKNISEWYNEEQRKNVEIHAQIMIVDSLAQRFRAFQQFEEETECLSKTRSLLFQFFLRHNRFHSLLKPFLWYIDVTLRSLTRFFIAIGIWVIIFSIIYSGIYYFHNRHYSLKNALESFIASTKFFFTNESKQQWDCVCPLTTKNNLCISPKPCGSLWNHGWDILLILQSIIAFFNFSILLAHIYTIVMRR